MKPRLVLPIVVTAALVPRMVPLRAADIPSLSLVSDRLADVSLSEHVAKLRLKAPKEFTILTAPPFVVLGYDSLEIVKQHTRRTVKWAVDKLKQDYFMSNPSEVISIWLFNEDASYQKHAKLIFDDTPTTPYGYYSAVHRALVMNISTGNGTLLHEQSAKRNGHIHGLMNWRFTRLEHALREGRLIAFEKLTAMNEREFYGGPDNPNYNQHYAKSYYLCFYLQDMGPLIKFYREFTADIKKDPSRYQILQRVLVEKSMEAFQK